MKTTLYFTMALILVSLASATIISDTTSTFTDDISLIGDLTVTGTVDGVDVSALNTITGSVTSAEMDQIENIGANLITAAIWGYVAAMNQQVATTSAPTFTTINTGQGANELYAMNQNVTTTSNVTLNKLTVTTAQNTNSLTLNTNGDGRSINIATQAATEHAIYVNMLDASTGTGLYLLRNGNDYVTFVNNPLSDSNVFYRNLASAQTGGPVVKIDQNNVGDDQVPLEIEQSGTGYGLRVTNVGNNYGVFIDQNGDGTALSIDSESTSSYGIDIDMSAATTNYGLRVYRDSNNNYVRLLQSDASTSGSSTFLRNKNSGATAGAVVSIQQNNASDDQPALYITQSSTAKGALRINPVASAPTTCSIGDIYFDTSGAFCACAATNKWNNTISTGTCV